MNILKFLQGMVKLELRPELLQYLVAFDARNVMPIDDELMLHTSLAMPASGITVTSTNCIDLGDDSALFNSPVSIFIDIPSGAEMISGGVLHVLVQSASSAAAATSVWDNHTTNSADFGGRLYDKTFGELKVASAIFAVGAKRLQLPLAGIERFVRLQYASEGATTAGVTMTKAFVGARV